MAKKKHSHVSYQLFITTTIILVALCVHARCQLSSFRPILSIVSTLLLYSLFRTERAPLGLRRLLNQMIPSQHASHVSPLLLVVGSNRMTVCLVLVQHLQHRRRNLIQWRAIRQLTRSPNETSLVKVNDAGYRSDEFHCPSVCCSNVLDVMP